METHQSGRSGASQSRQQHQVVVARSTVHGHHDADTDRRDSARAAPAQSHRTGRRQARCAGVEGYSRFTGSCVSVVLRNILKGHENRCLLFKLFAIIYSGGLSPGDIITHINDKEVKNSAHIYEVLAQQGKTLNMSVFRGNRRIGVTITPEDPE